MRRCTPEKKWLAAAGASPKVAKCLVAYVVTCTNGVNACTDGAHTGNANTGGSAPIRIGLKSRREDLVHRVCGCSLKLFMRINTGETGGRGATHILHVKA